MKYLALTLIALTSIFAAPTLASATELPAPGTSPASSSPQRPINCNLPITRALPWCWKA